MNPVPNSTDVAKQGSHSQQHHLIALAIKSRAEQTDQLWQNIEKRAKQIGPTPEGMLRSHLEHWQHWGLND